MMGMWESNATQVNSYQVFLLCPKCFSCLLLSVDENYQPGDIRLVGGQHSWEGRVEILWNGEWGTISAVEWDTEEAEVVCRQLGLAPEGVYITLSDLTTMCI